MGKLRPLVQAKPEVAKILLRRFPGIGEPGADKVLLFAHGRRSLALDTNVRRVLLRLGLGHEHKDNGQMYQSVVEDLKPLLPRSYPWLIRAHQLLRSHGQRLCKRTAPRCEACPLNSNCRWYGLTKSSASS